MEGKSEAFGGMGNMARMEVILITTTTTITVTVTANIIKRMFASGLVFLV
jgi:hypothetical protein